MLIIKEMHVKTTLKFCLTPIRMAIINDTNNTNAIEDLGGSGEEPLRTVGGNINSCNHYGRQCGDSSKN
jgi:hypothetical protein